MAYESSYPGPERPARRKWPLAGVMWIDLVVIAVVVLGLVFLIQLAFVSVNASQQGISIGALRSLGQEQAARLLGPFGLFVSVLAQNLVFAAVPLLRVAVIRREPVGELGMQARQPLLLLLIGFGMGTLVIVANIILSYLFVSLGFRQNQSAQFVGFLTRGDAVGQALFFATVAIVAPIGEEVLFRGYVFNALRRGVGRTPVRIALAYLVSALVFALVHLGGVSQDAVGLIVPLFVVGLLLALSMHISGSLIPGIIAHAMNNGLSVAALLFCVNNPGFAACPT